MTFVHHKADSSFADSHRNPSHNIYSSSLVEQNLRPAELFPIFNPYGIPFQVHISSRSKPIDDTGFPEGEDPIFSSI
jgi:hypothetical protein